MIWIIVMVVLGLIGTHYMAYTLGVESGRIVWHQRMRKLQDYYVQKEAHKLAVKRIEKKSKKVAVKKKK